MVLNALFRNFCLTVPGNRSSCIFCIEMNVMQGSFCYVGTISLNADES